MAAHGTQPFIKVSDSNGNPIVGAKLYIYEAGTTTPRAIYSDSGLTTPMSNPLSGANASNASGDFPRFYLAVGTYKLRAETSAGVLIWEYDDIDTGLSAGVGALPISAGGTGATTAAAARANLDVPSNSELEDISDTIASFSTILNGILASPGGRLTLTTGTPVLATGVSAATAVYYTPYTTNLCPIYDGAQFNLRQFTEQTLTLVANHVASAIYDVFAFWDNGTFRIVTGPAWNTATAGAGARGTGAGTTELTRLQGIWVNANAMATARNGSSTYSVDANKATYLGSIFMDGTNGQISCSIGIGQSRKWGVWNAYNRMPITLLVNDSTATWAYGTATIRPSNNNTANSATVFMGLVEEEIRVNFDQTASVSTSGGLNGIGWNSTTAFATGSKRGTVSAGSTAIVGDMRASHTNVPNLGINVVTCLESTNASSVTFQGGSNAMLMTLGWRG